MPKYIVVALVLAVAIQLVPVTRDNPAIVQEVSAPQDVRAVLRRACYDCHSNETVWPWYAYVAPVSWLVSYDVAEGREHLNFSDWARARNERDEIWEEVSEGEMPLWYYSMLRAERRLSPRDKALIRSWLSEGSGRPRDHDERSDEGSDEGD